MHPKKTAAFFALALAPSLTKASAIPGKGPAPIVAAYHRTPSESGSKSGASSSSSVNPAAQNRHSMIGFKLTSEGLIAVNTSSTNDQPAPAGNPELTQDEAEEPAPPLLDSPPPPTPGLQGSGMSAPPSVTAMASVAARFGKRRVGAHWSVSKRGVDAPGITPIARRGDSRYSAGSPPPTSLQIPHARVSLTTSPPNCPPPAGGWNDLDKTAFLSSALGSASSGDYCGEKLVLLNNAGKSASAIVAGWFDGTWESQMNVKVGDKVFSALGKPDSTNWFFANADLQKSVVQELEDATVIPRTDVRIPDDPATSSTSKSSTDPPEDDTPSTSASKPDDTSTDSSSSLFKGGYATYFYQGGQAGACGTVHSDSDLLVALDYRRYGNLDAVSPYCGKQVKITRVSTGKSIVASVQDACPTCTNSNSLDLSHGAFTKLATEEEGMVEIAWQFL